MENDNPSRVLTKFTANLGIPVTRTSINEQLEKHPDYNSMLAFSEVLDFYKIPNAAYRLKPDQLIDLPVPFIAHMAKRRFSIVTALNDQFVKLSDEKFNDKVLPLADFNKQYGGTVLIAEKDDNSGEPGYAEKRNKETLESIRLPLAIAGLMVILIVSLLLHGGIASAINIPLALVTLIKTAGLVTAILLLIQSIDTNNPLVQRLCGGDSAKDCNAILSSKSAKVNSWLSWSEVGFFYFAGSWLTLLFNAGNTAIIQTLAIVNLLCLPYTFYSVYYQWRVAKQWCKFCCAVQALLWLEFFSFLPCLHFTIPVNYAITLVDVLIGFSAPVFVWMLIKPLLYSSKQIAPLKAQLRKFKYNKELFAKMLNDEVHYAIPTAQNSLVIGPPDAPITVTMVSNPYCQPCAKAHKALNEWISDRTDVKLQVVFSNQNNEKDKKTEVAAHFMRLQQTADKATLVKALDDWYEQKQKNYESWAKVYPIESLNDISAQLEAQKEWCKMVEITSTPTLFINGRRLPKNYQTEDLRYFI